MKKKPTHDSDGRLRPRWDCYGMRKHGAGIYRELAAAYLPFWKGQRYVVLGKMNPQAVDLYVNLGRLPEDQLVKTG